MENRETDIVDEMILFGLIEVKGIDMKTGDFLYGFNQEFLNKNPELADKVRRLITADVMELWSEGFVEMKYVGEEAFVATNEKSFDQEARSQLTDSQRGVLDSIIRGVEFLQQ